MNPLGRMRGEAWGQHSYFPVLGYREAGKLGGHGGKRGCAARTMMNHEAGVGQMFREAFDKLLQLGGELDFLKVSSPLNFKALGRVLIEWGMPAPEAGKLK